MENRELKIVLNIKKEAEEMFNSPSFKRALMDVDKLRENMQRVVGPVTEAISNFHKIYSLNNYSFYSEPIKIIPPPRPVTYREVEYIIQKNISKQIKNNGSQNQLIFTKDKKLTRSVSNKQLEYPFSGGKKRLIVFEYILEKGSAYLPTDDLRDLAGCASNEALRKVIEGINKKARLMLGLNDSIIEGRYGFGYRINPKVEIFEE